MWRHGLTPLVYDGTTTVTVGTLTLGGIGDRVEGVCGSGSFNGNSRRAALTPTTTCLTVL